MASKASARLNRLYDRLGRQYPPIAGLLRWAQRPSSRFLRIPLGIALLLGGVFSFLPVLGVWMLPLGLMLLAIDFPPLQDPVARIMLRLERALARRRRRKAARTRQPPLRQDTALP